jgi:uncharacterized membrane protein
MNLPLALLLANQPGVEMWNNPIDALLLSAALIVSAVGVAVILWGAYCSVLRLIASESAAARDPGPSTPSPAGRQLFATYLLPGLDFLIAGGVIKTLAIADWQQGAVLGGIVVVRTLLGLSTKWEGSRSIAGEESRPRLGPSAEAGAATGQGAEGADRAAERPTGQPTAAAPPFPETRHNPNGDLAAAAGPMGS